VKKKIQSVFLKKETHQKMLSLQILESPGAGISEKSEDLNKFSSSDSCSTGIQSTFSVSFHPQAAIEEPLWDLILSPDNQVEDVVSLSPDIDAGGLTTVISSSTVCSHPLQEGDANGKDSLSATQKEDFFELPLHRAVSLVEEENDAVCSFEKKLPIHFETCQKESTFGKNIE